MFRYVACVWHDEDAERRQVAYGIRDRLLSQSSQWQLTVQERGLLVCHTGAALGSGEPHLLHGGHGGAILGQLFRRSGPSPSSAAAAFDEKEADRIVSSAGRHLVEHFWGRYVAFIHDPNNFVTRVIRDPSAGLRCLTTRHRGVNIYWSWMDDALGLGLDRIRVNWSYITAALCYMRLQIHQTGLEQISQVLGGECVWLHAGREERTFYWNPLHIAVSNPIEDSGRAADELKACTQHAVQAWSSCFPSIMVTLSGGVDSSIVLACLCEAPSGPEITCVNYHSPGSNTDERAFAKISARHAGCKLIERLRNTTVDLTSLRLVHRTFAPVNYVYWIEHSREEALLADERRATAIFSGEGGDQLFYQAGARWAAADFLRRRGIRPALLSVAMDAARIDRESVWSVLRKGFAHGLLRRPYDFFAEVAGFKKLLSREVIEAVRGNDTLVHPLFRDVKGVPVGKVWHALQTLVPLEQDPLQQPGDAAIVAPLYSQPVLEACMRIPTYLHTRGGIDRAVARSAFRGAVADEILRRRTKGGIEEHLKSILKRNLPLIRELLLEGELVRERVLDGKALEKVLSAALSTGITIGPVELFEYVGTEAWLRRWREAPT